MANATSVDLVSGCGPQTCGAGPSPMTSARDAAPARIGPNAIIRMAEALDEDVGPEVTRRIFHSCALDGYVDAPPAEMVDEREVSKLQAAVVSELGMAHSRTVSRSAGLRTGDYLLKNRIPRAAQSVIRVLPASLASRVLLAAIRRNAWTFVGSGHFTATSGLALARLSVEGCPLCCDLTATTPRCDYFAGTFEHLFRSLVHPVSEVEESSCMANGALACIFEIRWR